MGLIVYGGSISPFVRKTRVFLAEKGLPYQLEQINPFSPPDWFKEISPLGRIPVLKDEDAGTGTDATLPDSSVICAYLERKKPEPALYPRDNFAYGRALWFEEYADSEIAVNLGGGVFRPVVLSRMMGKESDYATAQKTIAEKLPKIFSYLDKAIGTREFLVGDQLSICDIAIASPFVNFQHAGYSADENLYPNLARYLKALHARPSFAACIAEEKMFFSKIGLQI